MSTHTEKEDKNSFLKNNPFYLLKVSQTDNRRKIISATEELGFFLDTDLCEWAQNELLTPSKRIAAELDWFLNTDEMQINAVRKSIEQDSKIPEEQLNGLARLNAIIHNFVVKESNFSQDICAQVLKINQELVNLNSHMLMNDINQCRSLAGMALVTETEISTEIRKKRERIRAIIDDKIKTLEEEKYVELVTLFAEKYIMNDSFADSGIISDVIDQYEIWAKVVMETKEAEIRSLIESIKKLDIVYVAEEVKKLIALVTDWDKYAQPIQVNAAVKGIEDVNSRNLAIALRELAVYLHNEKNATDLALMITEALKVYFAELAEVLVVVSKDVDALEKMQQQKEEDEKIEKETLIRNREDTEYAVKIRGSSYSVPSYCTCCMKKTPTTEKLVYTQVENMGTRQLRRTVTADFPVCAECLNHRKDVKKKSRWIYYGSLVAGIIAMSVCKAAFGIENGNCIMFGGIITVVLYLVMGFVFKFNELPKEHATRTESVSMLCEISSIGVSNTIFVFKNWKYANLFKRNNNEISGDITLRKATNTAKRVSYAKGYGSLVSSIIKLIIILFFVSRFLLNIIEDAQRETTVSNQNNQYKSQTSSSYDSDETEDDYDYDYDYDDYDYNEEETTPYESETQFSQTVAPGAYVYESVVSISPEKGLYTDGASTYSGIICKCQTESGNVVWVYMNVTQYQENFDSDLNTSIQNVYAEPVTFSSPKKIWGVAKYANIIVNGLSDEIGVEMLINFTSIEK